MTEQDETFKLFHRYNKLVRRGLVQPLTHHCGVPYVTWQDKDGELVLRCYGCSCTIVPGLVIINDVRAVVEEHFVE